MYLGPFLAMAEMLETKLQLKSIHRAVGFCFQDVSEDIAKWLSLKIGSLRVPNKLWRGLEIRYWGHRHRPEGKVFLIYQVAEDILSLAERTEQTLCILFSAPNTEAGRAQNRSLCVSSTEALAERVSLVLEIKVNHYWLPQHQR